MPGGKRAPYPTRISFNNKRCEQPVSRCSFLNCVCLICLSKIPLQTQGFLPRTGNQTANYLGLEMELWGRGGSLLITGKKLAQLMSARPLGLELESKCGHRSVREVGVPCPLGWRLLFLTVSGVCEMTVEGRQQELLSWGSGRGMWVCVHVCARVYAKESWRGREIAQRRTEITEEQKRGLAGESQGRAGDGDGN